MYCDEGLLQSYLDRALPPDESARLLAHLQQCPQCLEDLSLLESLQEEIGQIFLNIQHTPPPTFAPAEAWATFQAQRSTTTQLTAEAQRPTTPHTPPSTKHNHSLRDLLKRWFSWPSAFATVAACAIMFIGLQDPQPHDLPKGGLDIQMYHSCRSLQGTLHRCRTHKLAPLPPGTLIQFTYTLHTTPRHLMIVSINELGAFSPFVPLNSTQSLPLSPGPGTLPHNGTLELDDYLGLERIVILISLHPFQLHQARRLLKKAFHRASRDLKRLTLQKKGWEIKSWLIKKQHLPQP